MEEFKKENIEKPTGNKFKPSRSIKGKGFNLKKFIRNIIIVIILLSLSLFVLTVAPNYVNNEIVGKTNILINNNNITNSLKRELIIKDDVIYLSTRDVQNFFDPYLIVDDEDRTIITYGDKTVAVLLNNPTISVNNKEVTLSVAAFEQDDTIYLPFSEMQDIFNIEIDYIQETDIIVITSIDRQLETVLAPKNISIKSLADFFSRTVERVEENSTLVVIDEYESGWAKLRTENGKVGYAMLDDFEDKVVVRTAAQNTPVFEGTVNMVWDYFYAVGDVPNRTGTEIPGVNVISPAFFELAQNGTGQVVDKTGDYGDEYVAWAKSEDIEVWAMVQNTISIQNTSDILNNYEYRNRVINNLINLALEYNVDGLNIDFEYMFKNDKDAFTQFIVELYPRMKEHDLVLSISVTAPDGADNWSLCFDRYDLAKNSDYLVFMAYDQHGQNSSSAGTTAGYDWVKVNVNKFLTNEEVDGSQLILGIPLYARIWYESGNELDSTTYDMNAIYDRLPSNADIKWLDDVRQNYAQYQNGSELVKIWIEDEESIREKLSIINEYELAGVSFWDKDKETDDFWNIVIEELNLHE